MGNELVITTSPSRGELDRAVAALDALGVEYQRINPSPPLARVAVPALIMDRETRARLLDTAAGVVFSGWVEHRPAMAAMPEGPEPETVAAGACFARAAIMVLQPCVADDTKIRLVAHLAGNLAPVLPYLNAVMRQASYTPATSTLTYVEGDRMIALYPGRIAIAKADEIVDAWLTLDRIRQTVDETWAKRDGIAPCYETRKKPPALEIFKRLPGTNCGLCDETTCMAFALRLWAGKARVRQCTPLFLPEQEARRAALLEICAGLGVADE
jgi:ArsR family metal-binding transcriptional regulator